MVWYIGKISFKARSLLTDLDTDSDNNYQYNVSIGSTSPDVKRKVMERTKRYLSINNIKFNEENL